MTSRRLLRSTLACALALSFAFPACAANETKPKRSPSPAQMAARERMTKCSAEWKDAKAGGKVEAGMKWPKFWSQCNTRHKAARA